MWIRYSCQNQSTADFSGPAKVTTRDGGPVVTTTPTGSLGRRCGVRPDGHYPRGRLADGLRVQLDPAFDQADSWPFHHERERSDRQAPRQRRARAGSTT